MKRIYLFMALTVSCGWMAVCQAQTLEERISNIYAPLDKSEIQSNILIHQTPIFLWPGHYNGQNVADSMQANLDQFGILYGQFRGAAIVRA
ncbi:MAG: hypothetical protein ACJAT4_001485 [Granulosicoccus sp.]|jgi:hypothetical protein